VTSSVSEATLSADGQHVAFTTTASLDQRDTDTGVDDLYVRDLAHATTRLADVAADGIKANDFAEGPSISADGTRVAFASRATNLGAPSGGRLQVWVHDLADGSTVLASRADGANGDPGNRLSLFAQLSGDGRVVSFVSDATNLVAGPAVVPSQVYRRDLVAGTTRLVSRGPGPDGAPGQDVNFDVAGITRDGGCVVFGAIGNLLGSAPGSDDFNQVYLRAFEPDCGRVASGPGGPPPPGVDRTPPVLSSVSLTHARFRVAKRPTAVAALAARVLPRGTVLRLTSSEAGRLSIAVERARPGHLVRRNGKRVCVRVRKPVRRGRCTAYVRTATLRRSIRAGRARIALSGRIGRRALAPGAYRLTLTARDAAGNTSKPVRRTFTIVRG
jgi:WD40-like Beta Propeller Repeat